MDACPAVRYHEVLYCTVSPSENDVQSALPRPREPPVRGLTAARGGAADRTLAELYCTVEKCTPRYPLYTTTTITTHCCSSILASARYSLAIPPSQLAKRSDSTGGQALSDSAISSSRGIGKARAGSIITLQALGHTKNSDIADTYDAVSLVTPGLQKSSHNADQWRRGRPDLEHCTIPANLEDTSSPVIPLPAAD